MPRFIRRHEAPIFLSRRSLGEGGCSIRITEDVRRYAAEQGVTEEDAIKRGLVGYTALPKYSRNQEFEADAKAVEILRELGYSEPEKRLGDALQILLDKYGNLGGGFFDSHPATTERIQRLRSKAEHTTKK